MKAKLPKALQYLAQKQTQELTDGNKSKREVIAY